MGTYTNYSKLEVDGTISSSVQGELIGTFTSMPSASALNEGKTIYYTGATSGNYVQNTFYTCTKSGSTYSWTSASPKQVSVDSALSETSTNPVQNKVIATALKGYATKDDIATVYKPKGSIASANLPANPRVGDVYNLTDASSYGPAGTNVVYTEDGTWDALAGIVDISGKQDKISSGTGISISGNTVSLATSGVTAGTKGGNTAVPIITVDAYGRVTSISTATIYPPTSAGTNGQIWTSDGSGAGTWKSKDTTPTSGSTNAITSGAVHTALAGKQNNLSFDSTPTQNSSNPVTSGGVYNALAGKQDKLTFDSTPTSGSNNPVTSGGIYTAVEAKQSKLTFDSAPTSGSNNPVTSGGIFSAINNVSNAVAGKQDKLTFDSTPKSGSKNPVTSGGVYSAINSVEQKVPSGGTAGQVWVSDGDGAGVWADPSSVGSSYSIVKYSSYQYPVPVMAGDEYSTNGGKTWTKVQNNGQLGAPFSGLVRYYSVCEGTMPITNSEVIQGNATNISSPYTWHFQSFVLGSKGYIWNSSSYSNNVIEVYDVEGNKTTGVPMRNLRWDFSKFTLGGKVYLCGGMNWGSSGDYYYSFPYVDVYDTNGNRTDGNSLSSKRHNTYAFSVGNKGYVCGGEYHYNEESSFTNQTYVVDIYDVNGNRSTGANISSDNWSARAITFNLGDKAYIVPQYNGKSFVNTVLVCDANGVFSTTTPLSTARAQMSCFVMNGKAYLCGGYITSAVYDIIDVFDTNGNRTNNITLSVKRRNTTAFSILDSFGFVCGGYSIYYGNIEESAFSKIVDVFDTNGNRTNTNELTYGTTELDSFVIDNVKGFVWGGTRFQYSEGSQSNINVYTFHNKVTSVFPLTQYSEYLINGEASMATSHTTKTITSDTGVLDRTYKIKYQNGII